MLRLRKNVQYVRGACGVLAEETGAMSTKRRIAVIGLGYVGLPVAVAFAKAHFHVVGFDIDTQRIAELRTFKDRTLECTSAQLAAAPMTLTSDAAPLASCDFFIVTVPTPIDSANRPDLTALLRASETVASVLKQGDIVVYESTVYPGATEDDCVPVLQQKSGLRLGSDFGVGYSPERINPGDSVHRFETITKVISGSDVTTLDIVASTYGSVVRAGVYRAQSIRVAEAAKVIENTQRDINIGFVNELSAIFSSLGIDTGDVLDAACTKWNFVDFRPGLVGGHCIGVDPYYLTFQSERHGHHAEAILAGRRINDGMGPRIGLECIKLLLKHARTDADMRVTVLGLTFKENVPDVRNSKVVDIIREIESVGIAVQVFDPLADKIAALRDCSVRLTQREQLRPATAVILAVRHSEFLSEGWSLVSSLLRPSGGIVLDVRCSLDRAQKPSNVVLWRP